MKSAICLMCFLTAFAVPVAWADDATKTAKVEQILKLTKVDQMQEQMLDQMRGMMRPQLENMGVNVDAAQANLIESKILALVTEMTGWDKMKPVYIKLYTETFNDAELDGMLQFYRSPAGQAMLDKMPALMGKTMQIIQEQMKEMAPRVQQLVHETMQEPRPLLKKDKK